MWGQMVFDLLLRRRVRPLDHSRFSEELLLWLWRLRDFPSRHFWIYWDFVLVFIYRSDQPGLLAYLRAARCPFYLSLGC